MNKLPLEAVQNFIEKAKKEHGIELGIRETRNYYKIVKYQYTIQEAVFAFIANTIFRKRWGWRQCD